MQEETMPINREATATQLDDMSAEIILYAQKTGITEDQMQVIDDLIEICQRSGADREGPAKLVQSAIFDILMNSSTATAGRMMCGKGWTQNTYMSSVMFGEVAKYYGRSLGNHQTASESESIITMTPEMRKMMSKLEREADENRLVNRRIKAFGSDALEVDQLSNTCTILKDREGVGFRPITRVEHSFLLARLSQVVTRSLTTTLDKLEQLHLSDDALDRDQIISACNSEQMASTIIDITPTGLVTLNVLLDCTLPDKIKKSAEQVLAKLPRFKRTRDYPISILSPCPSRFVASYPTCGIGWRAPRAITSVKLGFYLPSSTKYSLGLIA